MTPIAKITYQSDVSTRWIVTWPSTPFKQGKAYYATTYPGLDQVLVETAATKRPVSPLVGRKILPQIKAAIAAAVS